MLVELTVSSNICEALAARQRKANKPAYLQLISHLEDRTFSASYTALEIGSLGNYYQTTEKTISNI